MRLHLASSCPGLIGWLLLSSACQPSADSARGAAPRSPPDTTETAREAAPEQAPPADDSQTAAAEASGANPDRWGAAPVAPSAGCGAARAASGERTLEISGAERSYIVSLPESYDGKAAYPLIFGFHGKTRTHRDCQDGDCRGLQKLFGERAILVYMKSFGVGWWESESASYGDNDPFFDATLALLRQEYCVDESRVIVSGTSSGAFFANHLACTRGDRLLATFPVGGGFGGTARPTNCQRPIPALVVHGIDDSHVTIDKGEDARDFYRERNGCSSETLPPLAQMHAKVRSERDAGQATYGCVDYQDCQEGLLVTWCEHGEGGWDNSTHAWPTFGGELLESFLGKL